MKSQKVECLKNYIRSPYAWPGGYPLVLVMDDGECLCSKCAKDNFKQIVSSTKDGARDGWAVAGIQINWEGDDLYCANCNAHLESAYGE